MERHFHEQLAELKTRLVTMGTLAETMIADAVHVLVEREAARAPGVYEAEKTVNRMQVEVDEICFTLTALQQPAATDLRFILGSIKTNSDLERLADEAVNICNKALRLLDQAPLKPFEILPRMAAVARSMLKDSLDAFVSLDTAKARQVLQRDDEVDLMKAEVTQELVAIMTREPGAVPRALALILIARNIERVADHATNIAENVIFVVEGRDVRHHLAE